MTRGTGAALAALVAVVLAAAGPQLAAQQPTLSTPPAQPQTAPPPAITTAPQQAPPGQGDFVPVKNLPAVQEQLPAAPFVLAAYAFVWVALLVYVWSLWRRVGAVQKELADLRRQAERKA